MSFKFKLLNQQKQVHITLSRFFTEIFFRKRSDLLILSVYFGNHSANILYEKIEFPFKRTK